MAFSETQRPEFFTQGVRLQTIHNGFVLHCATPVFQSRK
jgi:hypothetical protein